MPAKKSAKKGVSFYCEDGDPMLAAEGKVYTEEVFFEKWQECLDDNKGWDFKEMRRRLKEKPEDVKWYVMKSVETFPAEDDSVPFVPGFIVFSYKVEEGVDCQAPRLCMKAAKKTDDMDEEAFMSDDIVDMKDTHEWRPLQGYKNIFVLCGRNEETTKIKQLGFGNSAGNFGASAGNFGSVEASFGASSGNFGTVEPSAFGSSGGFNFGAPSGNFGTPEAPPAAEEQPSKKRPREDDEEEGTAKKVKTEEPVFGSAGFGSAGFGSAAFGSAGFGGGFNFSAGGSSNGQEATAYIEDTVYPVLWTAQMVEDIRKEISAGMKIITVYEDGEGFKIRLKVDCDIDFAKKMKEAKHLPVIRGLIEKKVLESCAEFKALKEEYQGDNVQYTGEDDHERLQAEFTKKRAALLHTEALKKQVREIEKAHMRDIVNHLKPIVKARTERIDHFRAMLTAINKEIKEGLMMSRDSVNVLRILPEKDSKGAHCAFRPCKKINKAVGAADECYPEEQIQINPLTGLPMPTNFV